MWSLSFILLRDGIISGHALFVVTMWGRGLPVTGDLVVCCSSGGASGAR